jgi:hypothetical protein
MKFRALNLDYHAEATFRLWEQREKEPRVIIRLLGPEEIALVSNKDGDKPILFDADAALDSLQHKEEESSMTDEPAYDESATIEEPEIMMDITGHQESQGIALLTNKDGDKSIAVSDDAALHSLQHKEDDSSALDEPACIVFSTIEEPDIMMDITGQQESHEVSRQ